MPAYPLDMPSNHITSAILYMDFAVSVTESPFTYASQSYDWGGDRWRIDFNLPILKRDDAEEWIAFALSLRGQSGSFLGRDPSGGTPRGVAGGTPVVNGGGQSGNTLIIDGCPANTTKWLKKGDYFQLGTGLSSRLYKLIVDVDSDASGNAALEFVPKLRTPPNDNAALIIQNARGLFRMSSNQVPWTADSEGQIFRFNFSALEIL